MNEQTPTWTCPTCNRSLAWDTIVVDGYFEDILQKVPEGIESILVEPNGDWFIQEDKSKQIMDPDDLDLQLDSSDSKTTGSKKRKSEVIDLTLESGSDEDEDTFVMFKRSESVSASTMPLSQRFPNLAEIPLPMQISSHTGARSTVVYPDRAPEVEMYRANPMEPSISDGQGALHRHENRDNLNDNIPGINSVSISSPNSGLSYLCNTNTTDLQLTAPFIPPSNGLHPAQSRNDQRYSDIYSRSLSPISFPPATVALRRTPTDQMQIERLSPLTYRDNYYERIYNPFRYGASDSFPRITDYRGPPSYTPEAPRFQYSKPYSPMLTPDNARGPPYYPGRIWESPILKLPERHFPSECSRSEHTQLPEQYYNNQSQEIEVIQDSETQS
ncbi:E3 SUMO-protein ligase pli1 [Basidiobolus ranarum]|uniref:E3 SUMO-protein ligase pli1 n=2 Tax=Basidiobolus ranarum TaxID=34480 RepID=A0ABR2WGW7_9FUNG